MGTSSKFRRACAKIVSYNYFDSFILFMIVMSTILLTLENPLDDPNGDFVDILFKIDIAVSIIFVIELLLKVFVYGFLFNGS
jgi:hypothetical protein